MEKNEKYFGRKFGFFSYCNYKRSAPVNIFERLQNVLKLTFVG